jgi:hypothetical protein
MGILRLIIALAAFLRPASARRHTAVGTHVADGRCNLLVAGVDFLHKTRGLFFLRGDNSSRLFLDGLHQKKIPVLESLSIRFAVVIMLLL